MYKLISGWKGTVGQFLKQCEKELHLPKSDIIDFISYIASFKTSEIVFHIHDELSVTESISDLLGKLKKGYPVAYLTNRRNFYGYEFFVDDRVLIPRPETEILVEYAIKTCSVSNPLILDICTGSGCILISLLGELENASGIGIDICLDALNVANKNKQLHLNNRQANFICADAMGINNLFLEKFDIITCNPPYISKSDSYEASIMFEPKKALFAEDDGLIFYKKILSISDKLCNKGGFACFEIGADQRLPLEKFGDEIGKELIFLQDYAGFDRVMIWKNL